MPRNYTRTTKRKYSQYDLDNALYLVRHGDYEIRAVAESTGVPYSTIRRNVKRSTENSKCVFTPAQESDLKIWRKNLCVSQKKALKQILGNVYMRAKATEVSMPKQWEGKKKLVSIGGEASAVDKSSDCPFLPIAAWGAK